MGPKTAREIVAEAATLPRFTAPVFRATKSAAVSVMAHVWRGWSLMFWVEGFFDDDDDEEDEAEAEACLLLLLLLQLLLHFQVQSRQ